jgi:HK97 family phage major capsid protein
MTLKELRAKMREIRAKLVALDALATTENRGFSTEERTNWENLQGEAGQLQERISRAETLGDITVVDPTELRAGGNEDGDAGVIGMSNEDIANFSVVRLMRALANPNDRGAQSEAGLELEASAEAQRRLGRDGGEVRGATIPADVLRASVMAQERNLYGALGMAADGRERRDLLAGTAGLGGNLVATDLLGGSFIDILRNRLSAMAAGARMLTGLNGNIAIPRQTGAASVFWVTEGNAPTESQQAFDQVTLTPKTAGAFIDVTRRLMLQSSIDVEAFVRSDLAQVISLAIDMGALNGSGAAGQPRGILQTAGIGSVAIGANGGNPTWDNIVDLESAVYVANADVEGMSYLTNAKMRGRLKKTPELANTAALPIWRQNEVNGYRAVTSNQVPGNLTKGAGTNLSAILFGNFADCLIGMWGGLDLLVDPYTSSTTGTVRFIVLQDVDVALRRLESFCAITDAS